MPMQCCNLSGKTAIITGASKGIGKSIAIQLALCGAKISLVARNKKNLDSDNCIISNRNKAIESFVDKKNICFKPFSNLHLKNKRPFYVVLMERNTNQSCF